MKNLRSVSFCVSKPPLTHIEVAKAAGLLDLSDVGHICTSTLITSSTENVNFDEEVERTIEREAYELFKPSFSQSFSNWLRLADPDESDRTPRSDRSPDSYPEPLYYALLLGLDKVSQELIDDGVDVNGHCGIEVTALQFAVHRGYLPVILPLLKSRAHDGILGSPLQAALVGDQSGKHGEIVDELLSKGAKFKPGGGKPLEGGLFETTKRKQANYRSAKKVAPEYLLKIRSFLAVANENRSYWESAERLVTLVTDFEADTDDVEQAGYMYNRLFGPEPPSGSTVANYEKVSFKKEDADHERFRTNVTRLCASILMALAKSAHQTWFLRVDFILRVLSKDWMKDLQEFETIKHLDESCKEQVASIRSSNLAAAEEQLIRMESEMEERVQT
ncbi:hypothetical protein OEA41_004946 [Lepraria neglecta]|uniref:Ankyrin repeat protein n=1 Tax=Lepraria neglecta TaxID=209136 RepID=A0AAD9Z0X0_9LECA|nr:hypothetical protein OEA41_004946 [Lepraria neglecta]